MSAQSNISVESSAGTKYAFVSYRWAGRQMPIVAKDALAEALRGEPRLEERECLRVVSKHDFVEGPIYTIGNDDFPTVWISFRNRTVGWFDEQKGEMVKLWSFKEYVALNIGTMPDYNKFFWT